MTDIMCITAVVVFVVDLSGFTQMWKPIAVRYIERRWRLHFDRLHPFDCSLCCTFWTGVAYLLVTGGITLPMLAFVCLCAFMTAPLRYVMQAVADLIISTINKIQDYV